MRHLFLCREFPPAAYPPGGIGTYLRHIVWLLANAGETVHVIAHRWAGAPREREERMDGRLIVHRIALDEPIPDGATDWHQQLPISRGLLASSFPAQAFAWHAAQLAERLIASEAIDVVEAQEWEAPLYYLQLRRRLGLGPKRRPPCVVHLHSSTEQIFAANGWDTMVADYGPAVAQEAHSISAADALIAPSQFMARQALSRYAVDASRLHVIPYPIGDMEWLQRGEAVWAGRTFCHIGRLEPRKGVFECIEAIALMVEDYPDIQVDFIGADTPLHATGGPSVAAALRRLIPQRIRRQIRFLGSRDHAEVRQALSRASAVIVPSRWENFPYSCIEAMASGLPAVVSPNGGMQELVDDGICGWIAETGTPAGIAAALRRALDASGKHRERMGEAAVASVNRRCGNDLVVRQHLDLKQQIVRWASPTLSGATASPERAETSAMAVVVTGVAGAAQLAHVRSSLRAQIESPSKVIVVCADLKSDTIASVAAEGWEARPGDVDGRGRPSAAVIAKLLAFPNLLGVALVDANVQLDPDWLRACRLAFQREERLAVMSAWIREIGAPERVRVPANPAQPDVLDDDMVAVRISALRRASQELGGVDEPAWTNAWERTSRSDDFALTYPAVLGSVADGGAQFSRRSARFSSMAKAIQRLHMSPLQWLLQCSPADRREFIVDALRDPLRSLRLLARHTFVALGRGPRRFPGHLDSKHEARGPQ